MNCFYHTKKPAVATCKDCSRGLCRECATNYQEIICKDCNAMRIDSESREIKKEIVQLLLIVVMITVALFYGYFTFLADRIIPKTADNRAALDIIICLCICYYSLSLAAGWKTLGGFLPGVVFSVPLFGWALYLFVRFLVSSYLGLIWAPFYLTSKFKRLRQLKLISIK